MRPSGRASCAVVTRASFSTAVGSSPRRRYADTMARANASGVTAAGERAAAMRSGELLARLERARKVDRCAAISDAPTLRGPAGTAVHAARVLEKTGIEHAAPERALVQLAAEHH